MCMAIVLNPTATMMSLIVVAKQTAMVIFHNKVKGYLINQIA